MYNRKEQKIVFLDTRDSWEYRENHLEGSILIPINRLEREYRRKLPNKKARIYVYCSTGDRSKVAKDFLKSQGYLDVRDLGTLEIARTRL